MDRIEASRRPNDPVVGRQKWRDLLFLHWPMPVELVRPLVPNELALDLWENTILVGIVPFAMLEVRPTPLPRALGFDFLETNLRTYVHHRGKHPGVWFFSLEAASWLAVQAAKVGFGLPYHFARMQMAKDGARIQYETTRRSNGAKFSVDYEMGRELGASPIGTVDHFLLERYYLYTKHRGVLKRGQVHHAPYVAHEVTLRQLHDDLAAAAGLPSVGSSPAYAHYSRGVDVEIFGLKNV